MEHLQCLKNKVALAILFCALASVSSLSQEEGSEISRGIPVGHKAPSFQLQDSKGEERSLADFLDQRPVALVFFRSADW